MHAVAGLVVEWHSVASKIDHFGAQLLVQSEKRSFAKCGIIGHFLPLEKWRIYAPTKVNQPKSKGW